MIRLYVLDPSQPGAAWEPFTGVRPIAELRAGAWRLRERWEAAAGVRATGLMAEHVIGFADVDHPPITDPGAIEGPALVALSTCIPPRAVLNLEGVRRLTCDGATVAWILAAGERWEDPHERGPSRELTGTLLSGVTDLVATVDGVLGADCLEFTRARSDPVPPGSIVLGEPGHVVCLGAAVEPGVVFDVRNGPVVLAERVEVRSGSRLVGPLWVGPDTLLLGGEIRRSTIGPQCRVRGEVSDTVFVGYGNKAHDGFIGHSVLGHWVNLGAGTITSNLKNTYGEVRLRLPDGSRKTGRRLLGSLIGDHAKLAIGSLLGTGTVVGAGANVFGAGQVPPYVPPFTWGQGGGTLVDLEGFLRTAARVLPRRGVELTPERERGLRTLYARLAR